MFLNSLINYCSSLQTQTKVAIAGAVAVCGAAFAYWYCAKRCENDTETIVVLDDDSRAKQSTEVQSVERSFDPLGLRPTSELEIPSCDNTPREEGQLCLINPTIKLCLDISTISDLIGTTELQSVQRENSPSTNGRQNSKELVCSEVHSRQQEKSDHVLQVKEEIYAEFNSRQQVIGDENSSSLGTKQSAAANTEFEGGELNRKQQSVTTELEVEKMGLKLVSVSFPFHSTFDRCDRSAEDVPVVGPKSEKGEEVADDVKEEQVVSDEDETLFLEAAPWRDQETNEDIDFLPCVQPVEEERASHVERNVNLNRQRSRLLPGREAEVREFYETFTQKTYDYRSQRKTSTSGVRYGNSTFKLGYEEPYKPEDFEAVLARRQPQYIFLDDDDVIDVTGRPDLQEQFLKGSDLEQKESDSSESSENEIEDDRDFGYLDDLLNDDEENPGSEPQRRRENSATDFGFQGPECFEEHERDFEYLDDILNEDRTVFDEEENSNFPHGASAIPDGHPPPQCNNSRPQWIPFVEDHFDPLWASHGEPPGAYIIPERSYGSPWQQQGRGHESFTGNGTQFFSQPAEFARTALGPQRQPTDHRPGDPHPSDY